MASAEDLRVDISSTSPAPDGQTWATAFPDLQDALALAAPGDRILIAKGRYLPTDDADRAVSFSIGRGVTLLGGYPRGGGTRDFRTHETVLSGDIDDNDLLGIPSPSDQVGDNSFHVVTIAANQVTLDGLTIVAGAAEGAGAANRRGGGITCTGSSLTLRDCSIIGNVAATFGGGVYLAGEGARLIGVNFSANRADTSGGGMNANAVGNLTVTNSVFRSNVSVEGGGLFLNGGVASLINATIVGNVAGIDGGGIIVADDATLNLSNSIIWENAVGTVTTGSTASIYIDDGTVTTTNSNIANEGGSDPLFLSTPSPLNAPSLAGNLNLLASSPAIEQGDSSLNPEALDIAGQPRIGGFEIDLGAYEAGFHRYVDTSATGAGNGSDWANASTNLRDALEGAIPGMTILVAAGVYYPDEGAAATDNDQTETFLVPDGVRVEGGYPPGGGSRDVSSNPTILSGDLQKNDLNVDGNFIAEDIAHVSGVSANHIATAAGGAAFSGLTFTAGFADDESVTDGQQGSAIFGVGVEVKVSECLFSALQTRVSNSGGDGNAISIEGDLTVTESLFTGNVHTGDAGIFGGVCAVFGDGAQMIIDGCVFRENSASLDSLNSSNVSGFLLYIAAEDGQMIVRDTRFESNQDPREIGTMIDAKSLTEAVVERCRFVGNTCQNLFNTFDVDLSRLSDCQITGNIIDDTVFLYSSEVALTVLNTTIAANEQTSSLARSVASSTTGTLTFANTVVKDVDLGTRIGDNVTLFRFNSLIQGTTAEADGNLDGALDPGFVAALPVSEAPTIAGDYHLTAGSPLIDAGLNTATLAVIDLDSGTRVLDGDGEGTATIDIGAFEYIIPPSPSEIQITKIDKNSANGSLTLTVESSSTTTYSIHFNSDLGGDWAVGPSGTVDAGSNTIEIPGSAYGFPQDRIYLRVVTP